ncbi:MAG: glycosyltransferase family 87 protein [Acidobacteriota bacterium]
MLLFLCVTGVSFFLWAVLDSESRDVDFNQFYAAGKLAGASRLYNWPAIRELELAHHNKAVPFGRLPAYAGVLKLLTYLEHERARVVWLAANTICLIAFAFLWPFQCRTGVLAALCWSCPAAMLLAFGQDTAIFLFFAAASVWLLQRRQQFRAGVVLSLCAIKFHLAIALPVFLLAQRRWLVVLGGFVGVVAILGASFAVEGPQWPIELLALSQTPEFSPAAARMPNLHGLTHGLPWAPVLEWALAFSCLLALYLISARADLTVAAAAALAAGLLVSHHAYVYDAVLLLPAVLWILESDSPPLMRAWALLLCGPVPFFALLTERWWRLGQLVTNGFSIAFLLWLGLSVWERKGPQLRSRFAIPSGPET